MTIKARVARATAIATLTLLFFGSASAQLICTADVQGPNDPNGDGQGDVTQLCLDESGLPASFDLAFSWDEGSFKGNNTGDACVLFDIDGDPAGNVEYALCTSVGGNPGGLVAGPTLYSCSGSPDRCANSNALTGMLNTTCSGGVASTDPFPAGDDFPNDTVVTCTVDTGDIPSGSIRTNFCSFPSSQPNSNPTDCISFLGGGFIEIAKTAFPADAVSAMTGFDFSITGTGTEDGNTVNVNKTVVVNGNQTVAVSIPQGGPYTITETVPGGWDNTTLQCDSGTVSGSTVSGVLVAASATTRCEFTNVRQGSIAIRKVASPADGTDFSFSGDLGTFSLDVDSDPTLGDAVSFTPAPGSYLVTEALAAPFALSSIVCDGDTDNGSTVDLANRQVTIDLDATEGIICFFTNSQGADVAMSKTLDTAGPYTVGQSVQYTLVVSNAGPSAASSVMVSDTPSNLTIDSVSSSPLGTCTALPCTLASLANGASETITVNATISAAGAFDNSATASATEADPDPTDNTDNTGNGGTAAASADVAMSKTLDTAGPYTVGQSVQYTLVVSNAGPSAASSVMVSDTPSNLTIDSVSSSPLGTCTALPCTLASLANGASETITVNATISAAGAFDNSATASAAEADPDPTDNTDNTGNGGTASASADVAMSKTLDTAGPYTVGQSVQYTLVVSNAGPSAASSVMVSDTPSNLTIDSVSSSPLGTCTALPCTLASLANGASETITVNATISAAGAFDNSATASAAEADPDPTDNTDNTGNGGTAPGNAVLGIAKTVSPTTDLGGGSFATTVVVSLENLGNVVLSGLQASDDLGAVFPAPATFSVTGITSATLSVNGAYDGSIQTDLLDGTDVLGVGQTATVAFDVVFNPMGLAGPFLNSAQGSALSPGGGMTTDQSDDGTEPDANGNGDPGDPGEDDPTPIGFSANPVIGVAKAVSPTIDNGDGSFTTAVTLTVQNLGNVVLRNVQVSDDVSAAIPAPATFSVSNLTSPLLSTNPAFDGVTDTTLLAGSDSLAVGQLTTVAFDLTFDPGALPGPFANSATAQATDAGGSPTSDGSDQGNDPDSNGNGDPTDPGEDDPTLIGFTESPALGLAKRASQTLDNGDGSFTTTLNFTVENLGNVLMQSVQISDDLSATFPAPATVTVDSLTSSALTINPAFDGVAVATLLAGTDSLGVGQRAGVSLVVTFNPAGLTGPFINSALVSGQSPSGTPVSDVSGDGSDPDPNADGDPSGPGEDDPTAITFVENPVLGVAKAASPTIDNGDGSFTTTVTVRLSNLGNVPLQNLQASDNLAATFPAPATFSVSNLTSTTLSTNPGFDGMTDTGLLAGTGTLAVAGSSTVTFDVTFDPFGLAGPFSNTVVGTATSPGSITTADRSDSGDDVDENGDGNPGGPGEDDPTPIVYDSNPVIGIAKAVSAASDNLDGTFTVSITLLVENLGNVLLDNVAIIENLAATFPAPATFAVSSVTSATLSPNPGFDGQTDTALLTGSDTLAVGATGSVTLDVTFNPATLTGPFLNTAIARATGPGGDPTSDRSFPGDDPDPNGDGDPSIPDEDRPTPIGFVPNPVIGAAKAIDPVVDVGAGQFSTRISITIENLGNVVLSNVSVVDDLGAVFPAPATFSVSNRAASGLTVNAGFDGAADTNLVTGADNLAVGQTAAVSFDLTFNPNGLAGPFLNSATASGIDPSGNTTSDRSDAGNEPDSDGDGLPDGPDEDDATPISFLSRPVIGAAKSAGPSVNNGDGSFTTTVTLLVENLGNVVLNSVQISDDLTAVFPAPSSFSVSAPVSTSLTVNGAFDGASNTALLAGTDSLATGATAIVSFDVTFTPGGLTGPFNNSAIASAMSADGQQTSDRSTEGSDPDPNGDGDPSQPADEDAPTPISFAANPVIGAAKATGAVADNGDGTFTTTFTVTLENLGNVILNTVQVTDDLAAAFPSPATFMVSNLASATLTVNTGFDGSGTTALLTGVDSLAVGATALVSFDVTFDPGTLPGPFFNAATASAQDAGGTMTTDLSDSGSDPDANGNGRPDDPDEGDPTAVVFSEFPVLGVAKSVSPTLDLGGGSFATTVVISLENLGNVVLSGVQASDDLGAVFPAPATFSVTGITSATLSVNGAYDGSIQTDLLDGTDVLGVGQTATVAFDVVFNPMGLAGPFLNSAQGSALSPGGGMTTDQSDDGTEPDANGNGDPGDPGEDDPTPIGFSANPVIGVAKAVSPTIDNGDGSFTTAVTLTVQNLGNVVLRNVQVSDDVSAAIPAPATFSVSNLTSPLLSTNPAFDGVTDTTLLAGSDSLAVGQLTTVAFDLTFDPGALPGPFANSATAQATDAGGSPTSDGSDQGNDPDSNGNGDPTDPGEDDPTLIGFTESPALGLAKRASQTLDNGDGSFTTTLNFTVENLGNVLMQSVQISDDLSATFPAPATVTVDSLTSSALTINPAFDGVAVATLLAGTDSLGVGQRAGVSLVVTFNPAGLTGPFINSALVSGQSPSGTPVSDVSGDGSDPDPNADGDPAGPGEDDPTAITFVENPVLGVAKAASPTIDNGDGSFTTTVTVRLSNLGNVPLQNLQASDNLAATFPAPATFSVSNLTSTTLSTNPGFDGMTDTGLLAGTGTLAVAGSSTVTFDVTFDPFGLAGPFSNTVVGTATSPGSITTADRSDSGDDVDENGDGNPGGPGEDDPTPIVYDSNPVIGIAKAVSAASDNLDGTFTVSITLLVENLGNVLLDNVAIIENLAATFPAPATFAVSSVTSATLSPNPGFDGQTDTALLTGSDTLAVGATGSVTLDVTFNPATLTGPFLNTAIARATGPGGDPTSDRSFPGDDPDPNGDGDPSIPDEDRPTPIGFVPNPVIGAAKAVSPAIDNGDGTFTTTVSLTLRNLGNVILNNVQLADNLDAAFPAPATVSVSNPSSPLLAINPAFDGVGDVNLLAGTDTLGVGQAATASFDLTFNPNGLAGPFLNSATGSANGPGNVPVSDLSDVGSNPDSNGNGDPSDPGENDPTPIGYTGTPVIGLAKAASPAIDNGNGSFSTNVTLHMENLGNTPLTDVSLRDDLAAAFPPPATAMVSNLSSNNLAVNPAYDGGAQVELLAPGQTLGVGQLAAVSFDITFNPSGLAGPFLNLATVSAMGPGGTVTTDRSDSGTDPDPDGNGDPGDPDEDDPSPIDFTSRPIIGTAKAIAPVADAGGGAFATRITITVENLGNVVLGNVSVVDDLSAVFPPPATFSVSNRAASGLTVNAAFDGAADTDLVSGTDTLAVGQTGTVSFDLTFNPNGLAGPFLNSAIGSATDPSGGTTSDRSDNGTNPDGDGDGLPDGPEEDEPTPIGFQPRPVIGAAKVASPSVDNGNGSFTTSVTLLVENLGNVVLNGVQINDDLSTVFPSPAGFSVGAPLSTSLTVNAAYNGRTNTALLAGSDSLAVGETATVSFDVTFAPGGLAGPFNNSALASGLSPGGQTTSDRSTDGTDPDPNGDGDPSLPESEDMPTPISFTQAGSIGVAKAAGTVADHGNGTYTIPLEMTLENLGNVSLSNVQLRDDLRAVFPLPALFDVANLWSATLSINPAFDGEGDINLLLGVDTLAPGEVATVMVDVTVFPNGLQGPFLNLATVSADGPGGSAVTDVSVNGSDPDPDNNGNPDETGPTAMSIPASPMAIPALNGLGLLLLILVLGGAGLAAGRAGYRH